MEPNEVIRQIAEGHNLDPNDINSEVFEDRPLIAETDLAVKVQRLCKARRYDDAAKLIETDVRLSHDVEDLP